MATLILPSYLITTAQETPKQNWGARVVTDRITEVGPNAELQARYPEDDLIDGAGHVLAPGFVNAHVHLYGVLAQASRCPAAMRRSVAAGLFWMISGGRWSKMR